jgi:Putative zinc binding domain
VSISGDQRAGHRLPCRFCGTEVTESFVDLGMSPPCQTHIDQEQLNHMEPFYPLHAWVCSRCFLVQLEEYVAPSSIFSEYAYFSSYSDSWVEHARKYTELMRQRFGLDVNSLVMEIASNDGYLLQHFARAGVPVLGIEPAANIASAVFGPKCVSTGAAAPKRTAQNMVRPTSCWVTTCWRMCQTSTIL